MGTSFSSLAKQQFINLTTYRKSGLPVSTPVWFALDGERLVGTSQPHTGKIKRIRNNPKVAISSQHDERQAAWRSNRWRGTGAAA